MVKKVNLPGDSTLFDSTPDVVSEAKYRLLCCPGEELSCLRKSTGGNSTAGEFSATLLDSNSASGALRLFFACIDFTDLKMFT